MTSTDFLVQKKIFIKDRCNQDGSFEKFPIAFSRDTGIRTAQEFRSALIEFAKFHLENKTPIEEIK